VPLQTGDKTCVPSIARARTTESLSFKDGEGVCLLARALFSVLNKLVKLREEGRSVDCLCKGDAGCVSPNVLDDGGGGESRAGLCPTRLKLPAHGADAVLCQFKTRARKDESIFAYKSVFTSVQSRASTSSVGETFGFLLAGASDAVSPYSVATAYKLW